MDLTTILNPLLDFAGLVVMGLVSLAVTRLTAMARSWLAHQSVSRAANTAAGQVLMQIAQGSVALAEVDAVHPSVAQAAADALVRVPSATAALGGFTPASMAQLVVGAIGNALAAPMVSSASPATSASAVVAKVAGAAATVAANAAMGQAIGTAAEGAVDALARGFGSGPLLGAATAGAATVPAVVVKP